jgi:tripartite-type tricarboxylate transporter receptor subunit TctC
MLKKLFYAILFSLMSTAVLASGLKANTIEIVVPYPPGGNSDRVARQVEEILNTNGYKAVVVNRPGADTVIGANYVAKAKPDGYTLYMGGNGFLDSNIAFKTKAPGIEYTTSSFVPVVPLGYTPLALVAPKNSPFQTYDEFKKYIRSNPDKFNLGFWNSYTAKLFLEWAEVENLPAPTIINYKGSAPQVVDIVNGNLLVAFDTQTTARQYADADKITYLANLSDLAKKNPSIDLRIWYGIYAPAGTNNSIIKELNQVINQSVNSPKYKERFQQLEIYDVGGSQEKLKRTQEKTYNILHNVSLKHE